MPKVSINEGQLILELAAGERIRAGRASLTIDLWRVQSVSVIGTELREKLGIQSEGRTRHTGVFVKRSEKSFVYWPKKTPAVLIKVTDPGWAEIIVGAVDAQSLSETLNKAIANNTKL